MVLRLSEDEAVVLVEALEVYTRRLRPRASRAFRGGISARAGAGEPTTTDRLLLAGGRVLVRAYRLLGH